ncbi:MAG: radical SAM protein [Candidatus Omnitrophota bacterium]|jgi:radical SAM superfamily enzyme YgiQ (UPF0313 family)
MRIVLLNLPWRKQGCFGVRAGSRWPFTVKPRTEGPLQYLPFPFFLAYATALLNQQKHNAMLIDAIAQGMDEHLILDKVRLLMPELMVIETSTPSFDNDINIIKGLARAVPACQIVLCGPHASVYPKFILEQYDFVSFVLVGEYEMTLADLAKARSQGLPLRSVPGLAFRKGKEVFVTARRKTLGDLDSLPLPERESLPLYNYNDGFCGLAQPNVQMVSSRGCPFNCTYCLWPQTLYFERKYRKRNPVKVIDEMEFLIKNYRFKAVYFDDDLFNYDKDHVAGICREIVKRGISIPWAVMARADLMNEGMLEQMSEAGLYAVKYGIEAVNKNILGLCRKQMNLKKACSMIAFTKKLGIKIHLTFCLGLPGETNTTLRETRDFIDAVKPDSLQFSFATPFPGTRYFDFVEKKGYLVSRDWGDYDGNLRCIVKTAALSAQELEGVRNDLYRYYNLQ